MAAPNLNGMTVAQANAALAGTGYRITGISAAGQQVPASQAGSDPIVSYTPYPDGTVRVGLQNAVSAAAAGGTGGNSTGGSTSGGTNSSSGTGSGATTAPTPAGGTAGGTTPVIPGQSGQQSWDTSSANQASQSGTVATGQGIQQYQAGQSQSMAALQTFFGTGSGYAPQYLPQYTPAQATAQNVNQLAQQSAVAASGSVT